MHSDTGGISYRDLKYGYGVENSALQVKVRNLELGVYPLRTMPSSLNPLLRQVRISTPVSVTYLRHPAAV
jgi:hypothetical protein